jgi:hypothetical protein
MLVVPRAGEHSDGTHHLSTEHGYPVPEHESSMATSVLPLLVSRRNIFTDTNGQSYLVWKTDGNCCSERTEPR